MLDIVINFSIFFIELKDYNTNEYGHVFAVYSRTLCKLFLHGQLL